MTIHRRPSDMVVIEDDRRKHQEHFHCNTAIGWNQKRKTPHDYTQPHKIIYIPIEPKIPEFVDKFDSPIEGHWLFWSSEAKGWPRYEWLQCPFHPDDTLTLQFGWVKEYVEIRQPASTMPDHLGQQYNVVKVLGVEEKEVPYCHEVGLRGAVMSMQKTWDWKIIGRIK